MKTLGWGVMTYVAFTVGLGALLYVTGDPSHFDPIFRQKYAAHLGLVVAHGVLSILALVSGPAQFWGALRRQHPELHRALGYLYLASVLVGGLTAIPMGAMAEGGLWSRLGFELSAMLWLLTGWMALQTARRRNFAAHRLWILRSYALTFGAVLLRLSLFGLQQAGWSFEQVYACTPWLSWGLSLLAAELIAGGFRDQPYRLRPQA